MSASWKGLAASLLTSRRTIARVGRDRWARRFGNRQSSNAGGPKRSRPIFGRLVEPALRAGWLGNEKRKPARSAGSTSAIASAGLKNKRPLDVPAVLFELRSRSAW